MVGLLGGMGAGKSTVASIFSQLGAQTLDADTIAHAVLDAPSVKRRLKNLYGKSIFNGKGLVDRAALARLAFRSERNLRQLEGVVHPEVIRRIRTSIRALGGVIVLDAPLILECRLDSICDALVYVKAPARLRRARLLVARKWTEKEIARREKFQAPLQKKSARARYCVDNDGDLARTRSRVKDIWERIRKTMQAA